MASYTATAVINLQQQRITFRQVTTDHLDHTGMGMTHDVGQAFLGNTQDLLCPLSGNIKQGTVNIHHPDHAYPHFVQCVLYPVAQPAQCINHRSLHALDTVNHDFEIQQTLFERQRDGLLFGNAGIKCGQDIDQLGTYSIMQILRDAPTFVGHCRRRKISVRKKSGDVLPGRMGTYLSCFRHGSRSGTSDPIGDR